MSSYESLTPEKRGRLKLQVGYCQTLLDSVLLRDLAESLPPETVSALQSLCDSLIVYHNLPIIVWKYRLKNPTARKKKMLKLAGSKREFMDSSKLRFNYIYGTRLLLAATLNSLQGKTSPQAIKLVEALLDLDECFYIHELDPNEYCSWDLDDQLTLALTINPHIQIFLSRVDQTRQTQLVMV